METTDNLRTSTDSTAISNCPSSSASFGCNPAAAPSPAPDADALSTFFTRFARRRTEIDAVPDDELVAVNVDVLTAISVVKAALPKIRSLMPSIALLPFIDQAKIAGLEDYTLALGHTHERWRAALDPEEALPELGAQALRLRQVFTADAIALAQRGWLDATKAASFQRGKGYKGTVDDLLGLCGLFRDHWSVIASRTAIQLDEVGAAEDLVDRTLGALGERQQQPTKVADAQRTRQRAYTLFAKSYEETRRAVSFLRWHEGDADKIAPSLFAGRNAGSRSARDEEPAAAAPPAPPATPAASTATTPAAPQASAPIVPHVETNGIPVGMAGATPYLPT